MQVIRVLAVVRRRVVGGVGIEGEGQDLECLSKTSGFQKLSTS